MPKISRKGYLMPESPIRKLVPFAEEAKKRGMKVYHLNIGQPDIPTPREVLDRLATFDEPNIAYGPSEGLPELIEVLPNEIETQRRTAADVVAARKRQLLDTRDFAYPFAPQDLDVLAVERPVLVDRQFAEDQSAGVAVREDAEVVDRRRVVRMIRHHLVETD